VAIEGQTRLDFDRSVNKLNNSVHTTLRLIRYVRTTIELHEVVTHV
jgi:hypothetical protein